MHLIKSGKTERIEARFLATNFYLRVQCDNRKLISKYAQEIKFYIILSARLIKS